MSNSINLRTKVHFRENIWWPIEDVECWNYMRKHADVPEILASMVSERRVVIQAGGNAGFYIKKYAELFNTVYTFEPEPVNFLCLTLNCDTPNVIKFQACVGDRTGFVSMTHNLRDVGATHISGTGILPTLKIDDLGLEQCDLIQLDTEGFEYFGLLGARNTISKFKPLVSIEWCDPWAARYGVTLEMVENFLSEYNYKFIQSHGADRIYQAS